MNWTKFYPLYKINWKNLYWKRSIINEKYLHNSLQHEPQVDHKYSTIQDEYQVTISLQRLHLDHYRLNVFIWIIIVLSGGSSIAVPGKVPERENQKILDN